MRTILTTVALLALVSAPAAAQGSLSTQGFGYPPGQLSAHALGAGGAIGETDPQSAINPAALAGWGRAAVLFTWAPEFRRIDIGTASDRSSVSRFPLIAAAVPIGERLTVGLSASTLADRSFRVSYPVSELFDDVPVTSTETIEALGAINDVRLAGAYRLSSRLQVGAALHGITGENRVTKSRTNFEQGAGFSQRDRVSYGGIAGSVGAIWTPATPFTIAASARLGGRLRAYVNDSVATEASVPDRGGVELRYSGVRGMVFAARADLVNWEEMEGLRDPEPDNRAPLQARLTTEYALGADFIGPRAFGRIIPLRLGVRARELPFALGTQAGPGPGGIYDYVDETSVTGGFGVPLARERAMFDVAVQRAMRSTESADIDESAWTISVSLTIRP